MKVILLKYVHKKFDYDCRGNIPVTAPVRLPILLNLSYFRSLFIVLVISESSFSL